MHGDRVLVNLTGIDRRGRREGMIARVLERRMSRLVGRFFYELGIAYVEPDDKRLQRNVQIPPEHIGGASEGQLVVCELVVPPDTRRPAIGRILAVLGEALTPSLVVETAIHGHQLPHVFPQDVLDAAAAVPLTVTPGMLGGRVDLRALPLVTIDGEDAKDFDDAVYCESNRGGFVWSWRLPTFRIMCVQGRRWTKRRSRALHRCISRALLCRCCRRRCPMESAR